MSQSVPGLDKAQLERICWRCRRVNRRGSLCLLLLREGSNCARRAFLQRQPATAPRVGLPPPAHTDSHAVTLPPSVVQPRHAPASILSLRAKYGDPLSRWRGLFARLRST
jgi:hypothetical protein